MNNRLYVGNLSYQTGERQLADLFQQAGTVVEATVLYDRYTGESRGFAFVEMVSEEQAEKAIEQLNGAMLDGRSLRVAEARPRRSRQRDQSAAYDDWRYAS